jgi:hypothetical protein
LKLATGLDGDCVVRTGHVAVRDPDSLAGVDVDSIAVFDSQVTADSHTMKYDILAPEQSVRIGSDCKPTSSRADSQVPECRILECYIPDRHSFDADEKEQEGSIRIIAIESEFGALHIHCSPQ